MLYLDVAHVPQHHGHGPPGLRGAGLGRVPRVAAPVDAAGAVTIDVDAVAGDDESGGMVLEGDRVRVVAPVVQVVRELCQ